MGVGDQGAGECDALLLPARELRRQPFGMSVHLDEAQHLERRGATLGLTDAAHLQAERDIVDAVEMRETARSFGTSSRCAGALAAGR